MMEINDNQFYCYVWLNILFLNFHEAASHNPCPERKVYIDDFCTLHMM